MTHRSDEVSLHVLAAGLKFPTIDLSKSNLLRAFSLNKTDAESTYEWFSAISGDTMESIALMHATFASVLESRLKDLPYRPLADITVTNTIRPICLLRIVDGTSFGTSVSRSPLEAIGGLIVLRRQMFKNVGNEGSALESEDYVSIEELVPDLEMLLAPAEDDPKPVRADYMLLVLAIEDESGAYSWSYRTSGPINPLELIGALDIEIERLRRVLVETE